MKGPVLLLGGIVLFSLLDANSKLLSGQYGLRPGGRLRYAVLLSLLLLARRCGGFGGPIATTRPGLHLLRACSMMVSAAGFYLAFRRLPLAEGYLVFFTAPFLTLAMAATSCARRCRAPPGCGAWSASAGCCWRSRRSSAAVAGRWPAISRCWSAPWPFR